MEIVPFSIAAGIGNTPLVELTRINPYPRVRILAKLEGNNPGGSVKDRPALYMLAKAEESGILTREKIILEPTSGNTGIALAMLGTARGYRVKLVMPACVSIERRSVLEAYGADQESIVHTYPSDMAQNFWTAIFAWTVCFVATILISLATSANKTDDKLKGLVYSLTPKIKDHDVPWYKQPATLGVIVIVGAIILNIIFW